MQERVLVKVEAYRKGEHGEDQRAVLRQSRAADSPEQFVKDAVKVALEVQRHVHNLTCKKGGRTGDDTDCRMEMPKPKQSISQVLWRGDKCVVVLQRTDALMVPWSLGITSALRCNVAICAMCCGSVWLRQCKQAADKSLPEPAPQSIDVYAALAAEYALKYSSKADMEARKDLLLQVNVNHI